ncbi:MAG: hypothetical protein ACXABY_19810 [Candidatus Thorarchaeota archaeon]|jgi:hypothetical protein
MAKDDFRELGLDDEFVDIVGQMVNNGRSAIGAYELARHGQDENDSFVHDHPEFFFDEEMPPDTAQRDEG